MVFILTTKYQVFLTDCNISGNLIAKEVIKAKKQSQISGSSLADKDLFPNSHQKKNCQSIE
jgi:hypothetical protein